MGWFALCASIKSCNRLFDLSCPQCDEELFENAKNDFIRTQRVPNKNAWEFPFLPGFPGDPYIALESEVRRIVGRTWGKRVDRRLRIPNQRGCFDSSTGKGGTLSARPWELENENPGLIRSVVAKTKGKARVVTLQNSYVKGILEPIHDALYDHISQYDWIVRGQLTEAHLEPLVKDREEDEYHISGDYSQATNFIDKRATMVVVRVLCESDSLTLEEKRVLWDSFDKLQHVECSGKRTVFERVQMMGSYLSFPILCVINRALYLLARRWEIMVSPGCRKDGTRRPARFNGDDCAFNGTKEFYGLWKQVTSFFGMVVNDEKTGLSKEWIELNSEAFSTSVGRLAPKPVLSFLACKNDDLLLQAINQTRGLSFKTRVWIVNHLILHEIRVRDVTPEALPRGIFNRLVKKAWFRKAVRNVDLSAAKTFEWDSDSETMIRTDPFRGIEMVVGTPPTEENREWFDDKYRDCQREFLECERGRSVRVPKSAWYAKPRQEPPKKITNPRPKILLELGKPEWQWIWPKDLYQFVISREPWRLGCINAKWADFHPHLVSRTPLISTVLRVEYPPVLSGEWIRQIGDRFGVSAVLVAQG